MLLKHKPANENRIVGNEVWPCSYQYVEAGGLQQGDLVCNGERGESWQLLGKLHRLDDALCGELAELIPQIHVQRHAPLRAVTLHADERRLYLDTLL